MIKTALYIKKDGLLVYTENITKQVSFEYPKNVINNMEIFDYENWKNSLQKFFLDIALKNQKCVLILSDEICFTKSISKDEEVNDFLLKLPFEKDKIIHKVLPQEDKLWVGAVNKELYEPIVNMLQELDNKIEYVIPELAIGTALQQTPPAEHIKQAVTNEELMKSTNFISNSPCKLPSIVLLIFSILIALSLVGFITLLLKDLTKKPQEIPNTAQVEVKIDTSAKETTESTSTIMVDNYKEKLQLNVLILNGSQITGVAAKLRTQLQDQYQNINIGNYEGPVKVETLITYTSEVNPRDLQELIDFLKLSFSNVVATKNNMISTDLRIETGSVLTN